ncbi:Uncharacterized protein APZ42_024744 [Daphnia magna]|nr:Uncharacterized protein APZ42_024744 [Daphnia magna]
MHQQSDDTRMTLPSVVCLSVTAITDGESSLTMMRERYNINHLRRLGRQKEQADAGRQSTSTAEDFFVSP